MDATRSEDANEFMLHTTQSRNALAAVPVEDGTLYLGGCSNWIRFRWPLREPDHIGGLLTC